MMKGQYARFEIQQKRKQIAETKCGKTWTKLNKELKQMKHNQLKTLQHETQSSNPILITLFAIAIGATAMITALAIELVSK